MALVVPGGTYNWVEHRGIWVVEDADCGVTLYEQMVYSLWSFFVTSYVNYPLG